MMQVRVLMPATTAGVLALCAASTIVAVNGSGQQPAASAPADLVLVNGKILTVDANDSVAEAVAISGGRIVAVGTSEAIKRRVGNGTRLVDLRGRTATPGLIDTHAHFSAEDAIYSIDLSTAASMADVLKLVREKVATLKPGEWVRGRGWDEGKLAERRYIYAADLDKVAPQHPVYLSHTMGHYGAANSYAMKLAGVTAQTPNPFGGTIDRGAEGRPSGVFKESAQALITRAIPALTPKEQHDRQRKGIVKLIEDFNKEGMTGAKDPGIASDKWDIYQELLAENKLTVRIFTLWRVRSPETADDVLGRLQKLPRPPAGFGDRRLLAGGVKLAIDGSGGARTAWMYQDWNKDFTNTDTGNTGYPTIDPQVYKQIVKRLHDNGIHVSTHAIGDRGIDWVVDTYDEVLKAKPTRGLRHGIIHANTPTDHAIDVMARLQKMYDAGYPESQSTFMWWIGDTYAANLGPERAPREKPFRTYLSKGIIWSGGSDYPVTPFEGRMGLWASVARKTLRGVHGPTPFGTKESVDIKTALRSYTIWAARQMFMEDKVGSIEVGKDADIAVWDRDPYTIATDDLPKLRCEMTLLAGQIVYDSTRSPNTPQP
jgi:predicted amidohydrolase YtcJ